MLFKRHAQGSFLLPNNKHLINVKKTRMQTIKILMSRCFTSSFYHYWQYLWYMIYIPHTFFCVYGSPEVPHPTHTNTQTIWHENNYWNTFTICWCFYLSYNI